jgi:hypothetical protein
MPNASFNAATDSEKLERHPFAEVESVRWSPRSLEPSIGVSFIKPGFERYRPVLSPFIGLSSLSGWAAAFLVLGSTLALAIAFDVIRDKVKTRFGKARQQEPNKKPPTENDNSKQTSENNDVHATFE